MKAKAHIKINKSKNGIQILILCSSTCALASQGSSSSSDVGSHAFYYCSPCTPLHNTGLVLFSLICRACLAELCLKTLMLLLARVQHLQSSFLCCLESLLKSYLINSFRDTSLESTPWPGIVYLINFKLLLFFQCTLMFLWEKDFVWFILL